MSSLDLILSPTFRPMLVRKFMRDSDETLRIRWKPLEKVRLDERGRITIPNSYREKLDIRSGEEVILILEEDHLVVYKPSRVSEFKEALRTLVEEITQTRRKPIGFEKLF